MAASSPDQARAEQAAKDKANANKTNLGRDQKNSLESNFGGSQPKYFLDFDPSGRVRILQTLVGGETEQRFLVINPDGINYSFANKTQITKAIRNLYKNKKEALRKQLFDLGYLTEREFNTRSEAALNSGVLSAANEFTTEIVDAYTVEGVSKFPTFDKWLSGRPAAGGDGGKKDLPIRDIELIDRDVVEAMVKDFYMEELQKEVDPEIIKAKTDRAMKRIKEGSLTTIKEGSKEVTRTTTPRFSQAELQAELGKEIPVENKLDYNQAQSINFISFLAGMEGR
ncbi:hypothetical protein UFOVP404_46 [uncultured Caudovirales phage]|jgi:hypothetical protein|uniref:Uncharacterized protein n=1 Tax=uncultured Caudovirales phage TaxID=2100421 RepID=A0A6J5M0I6_9CAUD|nr:hypothetical protein UFOVP404_46 [uncultured Caudovirales phage]